MDDLRKRLQEYRAKLDSIMILVDELDEDLAEEILHIDLKSGHFHKKARQTDTK